MLYYLLRSTVAAAPAATTTATAATTTATAATTTATAISSLTHNIATIKMTAAVKQEIFCDVS